MAPLPPPLAASSRASGPGGRGRAVEREEECRQRVVREGLALLGSLTHCAGHAAHVPQSGLVGLSASLPPGGTVGPRGPCSRGGPRVVGWSCFLSREGLFPTKRPNPAQQGHFLIASGPCCRRGEFMAIYCWRAASQPSSCAGGGRSQPTASRALLRHLFVPGVVGHRENRGEMGEEDGGGAAPFKEEDAGV